MIQLAPFLLLGLLLLALLVYWARRSKEPALTPAEFLEARTCLTTLRWGLLQPGLVERIFSLEDLRFVSSRTTPQIERLFREERKSLAIAWLKHTRRQTAHLMNLHSRLASYTLNPGHATELTLAAEYISFMAVCNLLLLLLGLLGPFHARKTIDYSVAAAHSLCAAFNSRLENVDPTRLGTTRQSPLGIP